MTIYEKKTTFPFVKRIGYRTFDIDAFASIDLGVVHFLKKQITELERENRNYNKWKNFEKSLDKPYEVWYNKYVIERGNEKKERKQND